MTPENPYLGSLIYISGLKGMDSVASSSEIGIERRIGHSNAVQVLPSPLRSFRVSEGRS